MAKKILVVDDEPALVPLLEEHLVGAGYQVVTAGDGREALQQAAAERPYVRHRGRGTTEQERAATDGHRSPNPKYRADAAMTYPPGLKEKLVQKKRRLAEHIEQAFADVPYPGDNRIVRGIDLDHVYDDVSEEGKIVVAFRGKHWKAVSQDVLFQEQSSLSFFTPEAYHFYLPAYLLTYLRRLTPEFLDTTGAGNVLSSLEHSLRPATDWTTLKDFVHQRLALLTPDQKSVVREFLHWLYRNELRKGIRLFDSDLSLFAYWGFPEGAPGLLTHRRWYQAAVAGDGESEIGDPLPSVISGAMISRDGKWIVDGRSCELIQRLIGRRFIHVDQREDGWTKLYQDPVDDAYWELSYPHSEMHGGGPPALTKLSTGQVRTLYALPALDRH